MSICRENPQVSIVKTKPQPEYAQVRQAVQQSLDLINGIRDIIKPDTIMLINPS